MSNVYEEKLRKEELLRASAPEMYEALKDCITVLNGIDRNVFDDDVLRESEAAIAKAEGKA